MRTQQGVERLDAEQCVQLLRSASLGRVALSSRALPIILPVTYSMVGTDVVFRVGDGLIATAADAGDVVCFQTDQASADPLHGWSVLAVGVLSPVPESLHPVLAASFPISPWIDGEPRLIMLRTSVLSGRRLVTA